MQGEPIDQIVSGRLYSLSLSLILSCSLQRQWTDAVKLATGILERQRFATHMLKNAEVVEKHANEPGLVLTNYDVAVEKKLAQFLPGDAVIVLSEPEQVHLGIELGAYAIHDAGAAVAATQRRV